MSTEKSVVVASVELSESTGPTHEQIAARAYEIAERDGFPCGCELAHWLQAEVELKPNTAHSKGDEDRVLSSTRAPEA